MKKSLILLSSVLALFVTAQEFDAQTFKLHNGAVVENGVLKLDGKQAYATIPGTENIMLSAPGVTFACAVNPVYDTRKGDPNQIMDSYFSRAGAPFTFCRWAGILSTRILHPQTQKYQIERTFAIPKAKVWSHIAFVLKPVEGKENTWQQCFYLNGKKVLDKTVENFIPVSGKGPVELGKGWGKTWMFTGDMADVFISQKALSDEEITELMQKSRAKK